MAKAYLELELLMSNIMIGCGISDPQKAALIVERAKQITALQIQRYTKDDMSKRVDRFMDEMNFRD